MFGLNPYIIGGAVIMLALGALKVYDAGYSTCQAKHLAAGVELEQQSNIKIEAIRTESQQLLRNIEDVPYTEIENVIAPVLSDTLDGLRERHATSTE